MQNWSTTWLLNFHPDKCHVLTLGKLQNIKHAHKYRLGDKELEHVFSEKDLGVVVDADLSFGEHIAEKIRKVPKSKAIPTVICDICATNLRIRSSRLVSNPSEARE